MKNPPELTLDNNCVISLIDYASSTSTFVDELSEIVSLGLSGAARIAVTTRVEADLGNDKDDGRRKEMLRKVRLFPVVGSVFRLGVSRLDSQDVLADDRTKSLVKAVQSILYPTGFVLHDRHYSNKVNDIDHLVGHRLDGHDIFVTADKDILKKSERLSTELGIVVMSPPDCLRRLRFGGDTSRCREGCNSPKARR